MASGTHSPGADLTIDTLLDQARFAYRYYVKKCAKPQKRAALALAVSIGSAVERDDEQGVAHIVEHLAFNATEVSYRNSCIHLHTSFAHVPESYTTVHEARVNEPTRA